MLNGASGDERAVRNFIINEIKDYCEYQTDALGSVTAFKKGKNRSDKKVMLCAHMDEVGFIITDIDSDGYLSFAPVGGIDPRAAAGSVVRINNVCGVIGLVPVHLLTQEEKKSSPPFEKLFIDIGAKNAEDARKYVSPGDFAYFTGEYTELGDGYIKSKALDDRIGCKIMIDMIKSELDYDTYFCFNTQEEVGLRGAQCTSYAVQSDVSVILEATTAADLCGVTGSQRVCVLGGGPVVSFMDLRTVYDRSLYSLTLKTAQESSIKIQTKTAVAGGNDAGAVQTSGKGSKVLAISVPCRYIHTASCVVKSSDIDETEKLLSALLPKLYD